MKIHRIYNELNEMSDISRDKVVVTMSASLFEVIIHNIWRVSLDYEVEKAKESFKRILAIIKEAEENQTTEWTK